MDMSFQHTGTSYPTTQYHNLEHPYMIVVYGPTTTTEHE